MRFTVTEDDVFELTGGLQQLDYKTYLLIIGQLRAEYTA